MIQYVVLSCVFGIVLFSSSILLDHTDDQLILLVIGTWFICLSVLLFRHSSLRLPYFSSLREGEKDQLKYDLRMLVVSK
jgi:hypothetical protein